MSKGGKKNAKGRKGKEEKGSIYPSRGSITSPAPKEKKKKTRHEDGGGEGREPV